MKRKRIVKEKSRARQNEPIVGKNLKQTKHAQSESDTDDSDKSIDNMSQISVDFGFYNMDQPDYHSIRQFLVHTFGNNKAAQTTLNLSELSDLITDPIAEYLGTTVKVDGEKSDPYGFITLIPLGFKSAKGLDGIKEFLKKTFPKKMKAERLAMLLNQPTGVVFLERMVNMPTEALVPIYQQFLDDLKEAICEDAIFAVENLILFLPVYREVQSQLDRELGVVNSNDKSTKSSQDKDQLQFYYEETEMLVQNDDKLLTWTYKTANSDSSSDSKRAFGELGVEAERMVVITTMDKFKRFVAQLPSYLDANSLH